MSTVIKELKEHRNSFYNTLIESVSEYMYREKRYNISFSVVTVFNEKDTLVDLQNLQNNFRETDTFVRINEHLIYAIFDATSDETYLKAAENLCKILQKNHFKEKFFCATANSSEFQTNYLDMTNKLFDRLAYAIENNIYNSVVYQDYII